MVGDVIAAGEIGGGGPQDLNLWPRRYEIAVQTRLYQSPCTKLSIEMCCQELGWNFYDLRRRERRALYIRIE